MCDRKWLDLLQLLLSTVWEQDNPHKWCVCQEQFLLLIGHQWRWMVPSVVTPKASHGHTSARVPFQGTPSPSSGHFTPYCYDWIKVFMHPLLSSALLPLLFFTIMFKFFLRIVVCKMLLGYSVTQILFGSDFQLKILVPTWSLLVPQHRSLVTKETCAHTGGKPAHGSQGQRGTDRAKAEQQLLAPVESSVCRTAPFLGYNRILDQNWESLHSLHSLSGCLKTFEFR